MKKTISTSSVSMLLLMCFMNSCATEQVTEKNTKKAINPPFANLSIPKDRFEINANEDTRICTKEGTVIQIPADCLVDSRGNKIKGNVELSYRSIDTPAEIIASGIPMTYDSAGVAHDFISAGMFEIGAFQKGKEVFIQKGKKIDVAFASYKDGNEFNFYKINEQSGSWSYLGKTEPKQNEEKIKLLETFEDEHLVEFDIDLDSRSELAGFNGTKWLCIDEIGVPNPCKDKWMSTYNWFDLEIKTLDEEKGIVQVMLSGYDKTVIFKATPYVMEGEKMSDRFAKIRETNQAVQQLKEEEEKIQLQADITRSFSISSFGTYNWDTIEKKVKEGTLATTNALFEVDGKLIDTECNLYHFSGDDDLTSRIDSDWEKLVYSPQENNRFLIVLPDQTVAITESNSFLSIQSKERHVFRLKHLSKKVKKLSDIEAILAMK